MTQQTKLALGSSAEIQWDGMKFIGRLTAISPKLDWKQTPGGACITGDIQLTFEVGAMGPCTLEELKEWLRNRTA